jgi:hypothetical protein
MKDAGCTLQVLSGSACCEVHACTGCGAVHLTIGPMTWRFQPERFAEISRVIADAVARYRALDLDEVVTKGTFGMPVSGRPQ